MRSQHQENTLQCIKAFRGIENLILHCELDEPLSISADLVSAVSVSTGTRTRMALQSVLDSVRPGAALLSVEIAVSPTGITRSYGVDRAGLVDLLLGGEILANLSRLTQLRQLHFTLLDNDAEHDSGWWTAEMVRRLPNSCHATVSVEVCLLTDVWDQWLWNTSDKRNADAAVPVKDGIVGN
ncbi:hypothetical protein C8Q76DRAFT_694678 [Earliella scabrosa]|nr:hypothetical protein C8Q76DRAFT_694678 [Earliella scabrosa]